MLGHTSSPAPVKDVAVGLGIGKGTFSQAATVQSRLVVNETLYTLYTLYTHYNNHQQVSLLHSVIKSTRRAFNSYNDSALRHCRLLKAENKDFEF